MDNAIAWLVCLSALCLTALVCGHELGSDVPTVAVTEGSNAILECSTNPVQSLVKELFDWKKDEKTDHKKDVFMYNAGRHYNNGHFGQHEQFKGRVEHFPDKLMNGVASIMIQNTRLEDSGIYTCIFPHLQEQRVNVRLVVEPTFRDRSGENSGVAHKPYVSICNVSESGVRLKCEVEGASPRPVVQWLDSHGDVLHAEESEVKETEGRYDITLQTTVNSTDTNCFRCVVRQKYFHHEIGRNITVPEKLFEMTYRDVDPGSCFEKMLLAAFIGALLLAAGQAVLVATKCITVRLNKGCRWPGYRPTAQDDQPQQNPRV